MPKGSLITSNVFYIRKGTSMSKTEIEQLQEIAKLLSSEPKTKNMDVIYEGNKIKLPIIDGKPMSFDSAIEWLMRKKKEEEQDHAVRHEIQCSPFDGVVAFQKAMAEIYGWVEGVPIPGFFGPRPPVMVGIPVTHDKKINVPFGRFEIPGITGYVETSIDMYNTPPKFIIGGVVKKKHAEAIRELADLTETFLKKESIYKGKAIKINFDWMENEDFNVMRDAPQFMDLQGAKEDELIFGEEVMAALNIGLFTPIEKSDSCRKFQIPLKRGILLHGPYGTGKTMSAYVTALKAARNGWTFVYLDSVADLKEGLKFAAQYAPAIVFAEDIDRVITGARSIKIDEVLNILDGVDTKGAEIITVLTTNHLENINPAMLRPGRLDTLVEVSPPDAIAASRLVDLYGRGLLEEGVSLEKIGKELAGNIPAVIREVVERAKISAIGRVGDDIQGHVLEQDILNATKAMKNHMSVLNRKQEDKEPKASVFIGIPTDVSTRDGILAQKYGEKVAANFIREEKAAA